MPPTIQTALSPDKRPARPGEKRYVKLTSNLTSYTINYTHGNRYFADWNLLVSDLSWCVELNIATHFQIYLSTLSS